MMYYTAQIPTLVENKRGMIGKTKSRANAKTLFKGDQPTWK